jgi:hypothetical protein
LQVLLALLIAISPHNSPSPDLDLAITAVDACKRVRHKNKPAAVAIAIKMLAVEKSMGIPEQFWGMSLAAACLESGFNPNAKGDKRGKKYKAIGVLQLWPFYVKAYGTDRRDPVSSTASWLKHIISMVPKVKKKCRYKTTERIWVAAWVTGIRYRKPGGRCREKPLHYKQLKKIRKSISKQRQKYHIHGK